jgi:hypothetical protein
MKRVIIALIVVAVSGAVAYFVWSRPAAYSIAWAETVTVYEGRPHQNMEYDLFKAERESKPSITLHDFSFYAEALTIDSADVAELRRIIADAASYKKYRGPKKCGGFHPDYAVAWDEFTVLICFGCGEIKILGPGGESIFDMRNPGELKQVLKKYQRNRPPEHFSMRTAE